jgi:hypothetical protein
MRRRWLQPLTYSGSARVTCPEQEIAFIEGRSI